jgi:hypothetical protein
MSENILVAVLGSIGDLPGRNGDIADAAAPPDVAQVGEADQQALGGLGC